MWDNGGFGTCLSSSPTAEMHRHVTFSEHADPFKRDGSNNFQFMCCLKWEGADAHSTVSFQIAYMSDVFVCCNT